MHIKDKPTAIFHQQTNQNIIWSKKQFDESIHRNAIDVDRQQLTSSLLDDKVSTMTTSKLQAETVARTTTECAARA